ncbi:3'-5' exonuclease [Xenorhabdus bovienii]|uniref:Putative exonuclease n=1 Tax=Xenorhabdus bovienii str. kraussei Becker Underwood TaxID=1398204 RepID=A0A077PXN9_XENBV|nr:3'-5' exonuclease [Xenorhabdus bovienii]CDH25983.1 putative exonuclease [Xenorhabdus bovienii str. kraussei Becker Underwood]
MLYENLMLDLETMGTATDSAIISIGAVFFDPATGELGSSFYSPVDLTSSMQSGGAVDGDTIRWWLRQDSEARVAIAVDGLPSITEVLFELEEFVNKSTKYNTHGLKVWGNGASFDNVILRSAYDREKIKPLWRWNNDRDVRTIVELGRVIGFDPKYNMPFEGSRHNALDDAIHQAKYVSIIWQKLINNNNQNDNIE